MSTEDFARPEEFWVRAKNHVLNIIPTELVEDHCSTLYSSWSFFTVGMSTSSALDHQRLIHFLASVKQTGYLPPNGTAPLPDTEGQQGRLWPDLPFFEPTLTETWDATLRDQRDGVPYHGLQEWRNLNLLAARLSVSQAHDLKLLAVRALRDVLEEETVVTAVMMEVVDMWLATYGYWPEEMAAYSLVIRPYYDQPSPSEGLTHPQKRVSVAPGKLAKEARVDGDDVGPSRWRFWRSRLQSLAAGNAALSPWALSALSHMAEI
ncbi:hypothetical protein B0A55_03822 [Friedmanniomyces simplex]|uniref:Uncharacterized protein n=1 Tax=Friedmanniomyces simplex TaxID=329884 RepID=A0A4U0XUW7_9PEZI|nr:hypothetical protein B0A55_03822 [Friedmanniomyces simplex]